MIFPKYGRVVVVDDVKEEAFPLIAELSRSGIFTTYFDGTLKSLPDVDKPLLGIQFIFLDMELNPDAPNDRTKVTYGLSVLKRIIGDSPAPYFIIAWTGIPSILQEFRMAIIGTTFEPIQIFSISKVECKDATGQFSLELIEKAVNSQLVSIPSYNYISTWENVIGEAAATITRNVLPCKADDIQIWDKKLNRIFLDLTHASLGKQTSKESATAGISVLSGMCCSEVEKLLADSEKLPDLNIDDPIATEPRQIAALNTVVNFTRALKNTSPGSIYEVEDKSILRCLFREKEIPKVETIRKAELDKCICIECEVTPPCDYAQDRYLLRRIIKGAIIPASLCDSLSNGQYIKKFTAKLYMADIMDDLFILAFDLRSLTGCNTDYFDGKKALFSYRDTTYTDLLYALGRQVGSPGIISVSGFEK